MTSEFPVVSRHFPNEPDYETSETTVSGRLLMIRRLTGLELLRSLVAGGITVSSMPLTTRNIRRDPKECPSPFCNIPETRRTSERVHLDLAPLTTLVPRPGLLSGCAGVYPSLYDSHQLLYTRLQGLETTYLVQSTRSRGVARVIMSGMLWFTLHSVIFSALCTASYSALPLL